MNCQQKAKGPQRHPDPDVVRNAEAVFAEMGMTPEEAVAVLYKQTALHGCFPITDLIPNEETQETARRARGRLGRVQVRPRRRRDDRVRGCANLTGSVRHLAGERKHRPRSIGGTDSARDKKEPSAVQR